MYQELKNEIGYILEIVDKCPDNLKEKCFELLINSFLDNQPKKTAVSQENVEVPSESSDEIAIKDFHVKIQRFLDNNNINSKIINNLYYRENGKILPIYDDLKSNQMAECQMRLSLLTAFENSYENENGDMNFNSEQVRQRCRDMKCYDGANFAAIYKSNANLFDNWNEKLDKTQQYSLSSDGKKKLAEILIQLSEGE